MSKIPCDPSKQAVARRIYRQFCGLPEHMVARIGNNTDTSYVDGDLGAHIALRAFNGQYVNVDSGAGGQILANGNAFNPSQIFKLVELDNCR